MPKDSHADCAVSFKVDLRANSQRLHVDVRFVGHKERAVGPNTLIDRVDAVNQTFHLAKIDILSQRVSHTRPCLGQRIPERS